MMLLRGFRRLLNGDNAVLHQLLCCKIFPKRDIVRSRSQTVYAGANATILLAIDTWPFSIVCLPSLVNRKRTLAVTRDAWD